MPAARPLTVAASLLAAALAAAPVGCGSRGERPEPPAPPVSPPGGGPVAGAGWTTRETPLLSATHARDVVPKSFRVSPDGRRFAYALNKAGGQVAVIDGVEDPTVYQQVADIRFGGDGKDVAIAGVVLGTQPADGLRYDGPLPAVVLNGKAFTPNIVHRDLNRVVAIRHIEAPVLLAVADRRVLYTCRATPAPAFEEAEFVYADDTPLTKRTVFDGPNAVVAKLKGQAAFARVDVQRTVWNQVGIVAGTPDAVISPNGAAWAAVFKKDQEYEVSIDGNARERFPQVSGFAFSPDGKRHAYFAARPETQKSYLVVDGELKENPGGAGVGFVFSPDGKRWAAQTATRVVVDGAPHATYDAVAGRSVYRNGSTVPVPSVAFSPDGKHVAYIATRNTRKGADGQERFDPHAFLVVDGKEVKEWAAAGTELFWSADNRTVGFTATPPGAKAAVVVGESGWPAFDEAAPLGFSPDGRSFAARVRHAERQSVVLDGDRRGQYREIGLGGTRVGFTPAGKMTYLGLKPDGTVVWVEELRAGLPDDGGPRVAAAPRGDGWVPLFNGRDLSNWTFPELSESPLTTPRPPNAVKWAVTNGAITFTGRDSSHLETAGREFRQFHLRLEMKTAPGANARLVFGKLNFRDVSVLLNNTTGRLRTGSLAVGIDPPGDGVTEKLAADDEWFTLEVLATGDRTVTRVNGKRVAEAKAPDLPAGQLRFVVRETQPFFVRKIEYRPLDDAELDRPGTLATPKQNPPAPVAGAELLAPVEGFTPLFNGTDTAGWVPDRLGKVWEVRGGKLFGGVELGYAAMFTEKEYGDFHLRAVVKTAVGARALVMVRAKRPTVSPNEFYAVYVDNAERSDRKTGAMSLNTNGSNFPQRGRPGAADGKWTLLEVLVKGRQLTTKVDGAVVTDFTHNSMLLKNGRTIDSARLGGWIGLKTNSLGGPIEFGRVDIRELK